MKIIKILFVLLFFNSFAYADKNMKIGSLGKESEVSRVIKVIMYDNYYETNSFQIKAGETIKFKVFRERLELVFSENRWFVVGPGRGRGRGAGPSPPRGGSGRRTRRSRTRW